MQYFSDRSFMGPISNRSRAGLHVSTRLKPRNWFPFWFGLNRRVFSTRRIGHLHRFSNEKSEVILVGDNYDAAYAATMAARVCFLYC